MTEQLEQELRHIFAEDAERAPVSAALAQAARRRVRQLRHARLAWATGAIAAAVAVVAVVSGGLLGGQPLGDERANPPVATRGPLATSTGITPTGPLNPGAAASCAVEYSPTSVTGRAFAFDGTVTAIGPARSNRASVDLGAAREGLAPLDLVAATFSVNQWYRGGSGSTVTVDFTPPEVGHVMDESGPSYGVGTRLLVSGESRWGGAALTDAIAWGCGFTRYYDKATADSWRAAFG